MVLDVKVARMHKLNGDGPTKAMCDVCFGDEIVVKGFRVVFGKNGPFVGVPRGQGKNGKWYDNVLLLNDSARADITQVVLAVYEKDSDQ